LSIVIKSINRIKAHALNSRLFKKLCIDNDEDFERLLLHTEVRWLSRGKCLDRIYALYDSVVEFLVGGVDVELGNSLSKIRHDIAYLADIFRHLNTMKVASRRFHDNGKTT